MGANAAGVVSARLDCTGIVVARRATAHARNGAIRTKNMTADLKFAVVAANVSVSPILEAQHTQVNWWRQRSLGDTSVQLKEW